MFTIFDEEELKYQAVEEPDPSLSYTYADYLQWKYKERVELIRGRIFKMSPAPNPKHQQVSIRCSVALYNFVKGTVCQVYPAPFDVRLPYKNKNTHTEINTVIQPDICVVCDPSKIDDRGCCGAPDLIVEILSPGNSRKEVRLKFELYEEAAVKEYWIINPVEENVVVYVLNTAGKYDGAKMYASGDRIISYAIHGFEIDVSEIFGG